MLFVREVGTESVYVNLFMVRSLVYDAAKALLFTTT